MEGNVSQIKFLESNESSNFVLHIIQISGEFSSTEDSEPTELEDIRYQIFVKLS